MLFLMFETLIFDKIVPIKRVDILKVYASSINPDKIKINQMKPTLLNKKELDSYLINENRRKKVIPQRSL